MSANEEWCFRAAASLAIDLMAENPKLTEGEAIKAAWHAYASSEPEIFAREDLPFAGQVEDEIARIRSGRADRVEHSPSLLDVAREFLRK